MMNRRPLPFPGSLFCPRPTRRYLAWLTGSLACLLLAACEGSWGRAEFERQLEVCTLAERNGLLEPAAEACGAALDMARAKGFSPAEIATLEYRLGRLQRQRGEFRVAESLSRSARRQAERAEDPQAVVERSVELALALAGQGRWLEGFAELEGMAPLFTVLPGEVAASVRTTLRLFATRLDMQGYSDQAERCRSLEEALVPATS